MLDGLFLGVCMHCMAVGGGMKGALTGPQMVKLHPLGTNEVSGEKIGLVGNFKASGALKKKF